MQSNYYINWGTELCFPDAIWHLESCKSALPYKKHKYRPLIWIHWSRPLWLLILVWKCKSFAFPLLAAMFRQGTGLIRCLLQLNVLKEWCAFLNHCPFSWPYVIQNIRGQWEWDLRSKGTWNRQERRVIGKDAVAIPAFWTCVTCTQSFPPSPLCPFLQGLIAVKAF